MTRDDIVRIAREAGFRSGHITLHSCDSLPFVAPVSATDCIVELQRFAELVAAEEREACAKLALAEAQRVGDLGRGHEEAGRRVMMSRCYARALQCTQLAADIRSLGKKP